MTKKDGWKKALKIICFTLIVVLLFIGFTKVFEFKYSDGMMQMKAFYEQEENSIDVLTLGSSTSFANINPAVMYRDHGVLAYNLGGAIEPMWNTYYRFKEALKTQSPSVIVLDVFRMMETAVYQTNAVTVKNVASMELSREKIESYQASVFEEDFVGYAVEPMQYHARYSELSSRDFDSDWGLTDIRAYKGYYMCYANAGTSLIDRSGITETLEIGEKTLDYFNRILNLAKENGIEVLLVAAPGFNTADAQKIYNAVELLAQENDINFLNFNDMYEELGLTEKDFADNRHLNYGGSEKYSSYLAKYITEHYNVVDGKTSAKRSSWEEAVYEYERRVLNHKIASVDTLAEVLSLTSTHTGYYTVINMTFQWRDYEDQAVFDLLASYGIDVDEAYYGNAVVFKEGSVVYSSFDAAGKNGDYVYHQQVGEHDVIKACGTLNTKTGIFTSQMYLNNDEMSMDDERAINVMVYDEQLQCAVAASAFEYNNGVKSAALMSLYDMTF